MNKTFAALFILLGLAGAASAQTVPGGVANAGNYAVYNAAPPTCVNGTGCWLQTDINGNLKIAGTVTSTATNAVGITPQDRTLTSASGISQGMMTTNASRHSLIIQNTGNANCGVNPTGGAAVIGGAGTLTLAPLSAYSPRVPTLSAVNIICTAGQPIYGSEN